MQILDTPVKLKGHFGYAKSDSFLGGLDGEVIDYSVGVDFTWKVLTLGVAYVNTDAPKTLGYKESVAPTARSCFARRSILTPGRRGFRGGRPSISHKQDRKAAREAAFFMPVRFAATR